MPSRGYRKGISDRKEPAPCSIRTHVPTRVFAAFAAEAEARGLTYSKLLAAILTAHQAGRRLEAPHPHQLSAADRRELCRQGNNLNQIARQAHLMRLHLLEQDARACIAAINALARRL